MHAGEQLEPGGGPGRHAAIEVRDVAIAGAHKNVGGAHAEAVIIVNQHDAGGAARHQLGKAQFEPAQRRRARPQQMVLREGEFLAHVDQRQLKAVAEHGFDGGGTDRAKHRFRPGFVQDYDEVPVYICATSPVFRSILIRGILSRLVPVTRMKRALSG